MKSLRRHWPLLCYLLIVALAALLRFGWLTQVPHTLWVDEAWFSLKGREYVRHSHRRLPRLQHHAPRDPASDRPAENNRVVLTPLEVR